MIVDVTKGSLTRAILSLAWPSVLQAILSNCYSVSDFLFIGHLPDKEAAAAGTTGIAASVGLTICLFGFHNIIPSGCNAYSSQFKGADDKPNLASTFKSAFWACLVLSTLIAMVGHTFIHEIASITNSTPIVTRNIEQFVGIIILTSPAFGLLLLIDGFFKSNGNTVVPLQLEVASLIINVFLNWLFVFHMGFGISGSASASALSRLVPALFGLYSICTGGLNDIQVQLLSYEEGLAPRALAMFRLGTWQSLSDWMYGAVFTILLRLAGSLGAAQQAGLGAGMRGLEWLSFCISEGFLTAAMTSVGNLIGANLQQRASLAACLAAVMSSACSCLTGLPFIFFSTQIASTLSDDAEIIKYCAMYIRLMGIVSFGVGFEMAAYGAFLGAGKARDVFLTNGSMNVLRVPLCVVCLFGQHNFSRGIAWAVGLSGGTPPPPIGDFRCVCYVIMFTAVCKALLFSVWLFRRYLTKSYFHDSSLLANKSDSASNASSAGPRQEDKEVYLELSQVSEHGSFPEDEEHAAAEGQGGSAAATTEAEV